MQVAIITGGNGRLGKEFTRTLEKEGVKVISFDLVGERVDIVRRNEVMKAVAKVIEEHGKIDILINNAAFNPKVGTDASITGEDCWDRYEEYSPEQWLNEFDVLHGAFWVTQEVAKHMIPANSGSIVWIGSPDGQFGPDHRKYGKDRFKSPAYCATKGAMFAMMRSWASYFSEVAPNVRSNALSLGGMDFGEFTDDFKERFNYRNMLHRPGKHDEANEALLFLCREGLAQGSVITLDGGQTAW